MSKPTDETPVASADDRKGTAVLLFALLVFFALIAALVGYEVWRIRH